MDILPTDLKNLSTIEIKEEFKEWDKLSDEALNQFEKKLQK